MLKSGETFAGRYRLGKLLGDGGFAYVFEATDPDIGRRVAIKILRPDDDGTYSESVRERFKREAAAVANLRDPHTVTLFDYGEDRGLLYLVFELVEGQSLGEILRREGTVPVGEAVSILVQILESLREAHGAGILHRDIKPDNIIIYEYMGDLSRAKLVDFGLAKPAALPKEDELTKPGTVMGTAQYIAPEAYRQLPLSPASDLFSVGLVFFEMLVGRPANTEKKGIAIAVTQASEEEFEIPDMVPPKLRGVLRQMIAKDPTDRFQSAQEALDAFAAATDDLDASVSIPTQSGDTSRGDFTAADFGQHSSAADLELDEEALAQRGASGSPSPRPRNRIASPGESSSGSVWKFGGILTLVLLAASVGVVWYLDLDMPWNQQEPVDPATLQPKVFPIEDPDTVVFWVDWTRGIVYADNPLTVPAAGRCTIILDRRSDPTPPGAFYVANVLDGYPEQIEATPIGRDALSRRAEWCNGAADLALSVEQKAAVTVSRVRLEQATTAKGKRAIEIDTINRTKQESKSKSKAGPYNRKRPKIKMPDLSKIPGLRQQ